LAYSLRKKKKEKEKNPKQEKLDEEDYTLISELKEIAISPELAAEWADDGCGKPC